MHAAVQAGETERAGAAAAARGSMAGAGGARRRRARRAAPRAPARQGRPRHAHIPADRTGGAGAQKTRLQR